MSIPLPLDNKSVCVIAELSANHKGSLERAIELIHLAIDSGADAIKIQTYTADTLTLDSNRPEFRITQDSLWHDRTLHDLYREAYTPWEWQKTLKSEAEARGTPLFSSPFDPSSVDFLESLGVPAYKIASPEIVDKNLIQLCAASGKPLIISTGMASEQEIHEAISWAREVGCHDVTLLKCTSAYPAKPEEMNLNTIPFLKSKFQTRVGLSDHTLGDTVAVSAVALGATIVEKHFTRSRSEGGPDAAFSMEPSEFKSMVERIRIAEAALGSETWEIGKRETENMTFRRSLYWVQDIQQDTIITREHLRSVRPANGLAPKYLDSIIGLKSKRAIQAQEPVLIDDIQGLTL